MPLAAHRQLVAKSLLKQRLTKYNKSSTDQLHECNSLSEFNALDYQPLRSSISQFNLDYSRNIAVECLPGF